MNINYDFEKEPEIYTKEVLLHRLKRISNGKPFHHSDNLQFIKTYMKGIIVTNRSDHYIWEYSYYGTKVVYNPVSGEVRLLP